MNRQRYIFIFLLLIVCRSVFSQVSVEQRLDSMEMLIGEHVHLTISAILPQGKKVNFPKHKTGGELEPGIEILDISKIDTQYVDDGKIKLSRKYTLTSFEDTLYYIHPQPVIIDGKCYSGKDLALKVSTVEVDTAKKDLMLIPFGIQSAPMLFSDWIPVILFALLFILSITVVIYCKRRLKDNKPILHHLRLIRRQPPHQKALKALGKLQQQKIAGSDVKQYYTHLTDIIRRYLKDQQGFDAMEMTTDEILTHLQQSSISEQNAVLSPILQTADLVKFAKYNIGADEIAHHTQEAKRYITLTKTDAVETEEKVERPLTETEQRSIRTRVILKTIIIIGIIVAVATALYIGWKISWLT